MLVSPDRLADEALDCPRIAARIRARGHRPNVPFRGARDSKRDVSSKRLVGGAQVHGSASHPTNAPQQTATPPGDP